MKNIIKKILSENDFDWVSYGDTFTIDSYKKHLSNCEDIPVSAYNISTGEFYGRMGEISIFYHSSCQYWWDLFKDTEVDEDGRGPGEWFEGDNTKDVAVIMPWEYVDGDVRDLDSDNYTIITTKLNSLVYHLNGKANELTIIMDDEMKPRYDLIPSHLVDDVRKSYESIFKPKSVSESIKLPVDIGDTIYMGKFKNKKTIVKDIEWNEKGDLLINGKSALRLRITKNLQKLKKVK
jgi:hypothetical protein